MAQYANLIATINNAIKTNGVGAITGQLLQTILDGMVNSLGLNYQYAGIATPSTNPGAPDQRVLYLATQAGTYEHFGGAVLDGVTVHIFTYDGTWHDATLAVATKAELAAYLQIADLASDTGQSATTTMTQKAITDALLGLAEDIETTVAQAMHEHVAKLPELTVGSSAGVLGRTVDASFIFRRTAGTAKIGRGAAALNAIYGRTLVWNQLVQNGDFADGTTGWAGNPSVSDGVATLVKTATGTATLANISKLNMPYINGHTYLFACLAKSNNATTYFNLVPTGTLSDGGATRTILPNWTLVTLIWTSTGTNTSLALRGDNTGNPDADIDFSVKNVMCFDLTQMFGEGNEPSTVAEFEALYPGYHAYNPGALISNDAAALETVGFNQWDEVWGNYYWNNGTRVDNSYLLACAEKIRVIPGASYHFFLGSSVPKIMLGLFHMDGSYTRVAPVRNGAIISIPDDVTDIVFNTYSDGRVTTYANDICINLSDPAKNGTYEPYWKRTLPLDLSTMTGKLNGAGTSIVVFPSGLQSAGAGANMVQDSTDGITATKRVGTRAYQTGDENDATLTTDGTNTNYPLVTPETYVLDEPLQMSYQVENGGTEQAVGPSGATLPSAPFMAQIQYPLDVIALLGDSQADMLDAMVAAGVITSYTMTYNVAAQKYEFTINGVSRSLPENNRKGGGPSNEPGEEPTEPGGGDDEPNGDIQEGQAEETVHNKK